MIPVLSMRTSERIMIFVEEIWNWFASHKRTLPWRDLAIVDGTERAYRILVSEIMLQQTQVERVKVMYKRFLETFPTLQDLARASNKDVILAWRGMGYNSRALRLRDAAKTIIESHGGVFPQEMTVLQSIQGIGPYTAAAIRNFAFHLPTPCLDTNIRRILHRVFVGPENPDGTWEKDDRSLLTLAKTILDAALAHPSCKRRTTADWHAALMDFGSLVCVKRNPKWDICPLTARGIMKTTARQWESLHTKNYKLKTIGTPREPGRLVGSRFIPNRIFRGKVVEELRDEPHGLPLEEIGRRICLDWSPARHRHWLRNIIDALKEDHLLMERQHKYLLRE